MLPAEQIGAEPRHLRHWLATIRRGLITHDGLNQNLIRDARARDREAVICNVREQLKTLAKDANLMAKVREGSLLIVGGFYEISSGMVDFIEMDPLDTEDPKASDEKKSQPPPNGRGGYMQSRKLGDHFERGTPGTTPEVSRRATPRPTRICRQRRHLCRRGSRRQLLAVRQFCAVGYPVVVSCPFRTRCLPS